MMYLYEFAIEKALRMVENDAKDKKLLTVDAKKMILDGLESIQPDATKKLPDSIKPSAQLQQPSIQVTFVVSPNRIETKIF